MKKLLTCAAAILFVFCLSLTAFAGSVPEDLLYDDCGQVFFAQALEYKGTEGEGYIRVLPVKVIKGDVEVGVEAVYKKPSLTGAFSIKEGKTYLLTYFDENNFTYIFRASSYDTETLELIDIKDDNNMWMRFENYLNEGKYEKAEAERQEKRGLTENNLQITEELPSLHMKTTKQTVIFICSVGACIVALIGLITNKIKGKKTI